MKNYTFHTLQIIFVVHMDEFVWGETIKKGKGVILPFCLFYNNLSFNLTQRNNITLSDTNINHNFYQTKKKLTVPPTILPKGYHALSSNQLRNS